MNERAASLQVAKVWNNLAAVQEGRGDAAGALALHQRAIDIKLRIAPDSVRARSLGAIAAPNRARALGAITICARAAPCDARASVRQVTVADSLYNMAILYEQTGQVPRARARASAQCAVPRRACAWC